MFNDDPKDPSTAAGARQPGAARSSFPGAVRTTLVGNGASQAILVGAGLVIAKLYGPTSLGVFASYTALTFALVPLASLRYVQAIPLAQSRDEAGQLLSLSLVLSVALPAAAAVTAGLGLVAGGVSLGWVIAGTVGTSALSVQQAFQMYLSATQQFDRFATSRVAYASVLLLAQTCLVAVGRSGTLLIIGELIATAVAVGWSMQRTGLTPFNGVSPSVLRVTARRHSNFPRYQLLGGLINASSLQAPVLLLNAAFGPSIAGVYGLAYRILYAPIGLISQSVSSVFFPTIAKNPGAEVPSRVRETARSLVTLGGSYLILLACAAPWAIPQALGPEWSDAVEVIWILGPMVVIYAATSAVSTVLLVRNRQRLLLMIQVALLVTTVIPLSIPMYTDLSFLWALAVYSAAQAVAYTGYFIAVVRSAAAYPLANSSEE